MIEEETMISHAVEVQGTLNPDGTLLLDTKPGLPPGRVRVMLQPVPDYTQTEIWQFFERLWAEQAVQGHVPRSPEEIDADIAAARQEDEEYMLEIERIHEDCERQRREQGRPGKA